MDVLWVQWRRPIGRNSTCLWHHKIERGIRFNSSHWHLVIRSCWIITYQTKTKLNNNNNNSTSLHRLRWAVRLMNLNWWRKVWTIFLIRDYSCHHYNQRCSWLAAPWSCQLRIHLQLTRLWPAAELSVRHHLGKPYNRPHKWPIST